MLGLFYYFFYCTILHFFQIWNLHNKYYPNSYLFYWYLFNLSSLIEYIIAVFGKFHFSNYYSKYFYPWFYIVIHSVTMNFGPHHPALAGSVFSNAPMMRPRGFWVRVRNQLFVCVSQNTVYKPERHIFLTSIFDIYFFPSRCIFERCNL